MSFLIPLQKLRETDAWMAFHHPQPAYPFHIVIVTKTALSNVLGLTSAQAGILIELFSVVQDLVTEFRLNEQGYRLITNGGMYQDFPLLHFHLVSDQPVTVQA